MDPTLKLTCIQSTGHTTKVTMSIFLNDGDSLRIKVKKDVLTITINEKDYTFPGFKDTAIYGTDIVI